MKKILLLSLAAISAIISSAQNNVQSVGVKPIVDMGPAFTVLKNNPATEVKNQQSTGTCWAFSTTSLVESQLIKNNLGVFNLSEMFTVRNMYVEKAKNYILRQGHAQFGEGGLGHDLIRAIDKYGAMPDEAYSGLKPGQEKLDHSKMAKQLLEYLDSILKPGKPISDDWMNNYNKILDDYIGVVPASFTYNGKTYTPQRFAKEVMHFNADDYVNITSFTHQPYYQPFIVQVPDNFSNGYYYNLPLHEMIDVAKSAVNSGYSLMWDADVSNNGFRAGKGLALFLDKSSGTLKNDSIQADITEAPWNENIRQQLYEELVTQDDHLMHITGIEKTKAGKTFFIVKNSWGTSVGPFNGYVNVSESYFAINTISLVVPKAALSKALLEKLKIK